jgi:hypothetical protein
MFMGDCLSPAQRGYFSAQHSGCANCHSLGATGHPKGLASAMYGSKSFGQAALAAEATAAKRPAAAEARSAMVAKKCEGGGRGGRLLLDDTVGK